MSLISQILSSTGPRDIPIEDIVVGPRWIMVTAGASGLAAYYGPPIAPDRIDLPIGRPALEPARRIRSGDPLDASLAIAALNALLAQKLEPAGHRPYRLPRAGRGRIVAVGDLPFLEELRRLDAELVTVRRGDDGDYPGAPEALSSADTAVISGSTIVDGRLESLLANSAARTTVVHGPSSPLTPILFEYGADQVVGIRVENPIRASEIVAAAQGPLPASPVFRSAVIDSGQQSR
jgi:hypothetical protein